MPRCRAGGVTASWTLTLTPAPEPDTLTLTPVTNPTTEPRQGPAQTIVFTFDKPVTAANVAVTVYLAHFHSVALGPGGLVVVVFVAAVVSLGAILLLAKERGMIDRVSDALDQLASHSYRIAPSLRARILQKAGEA